MNNKKFYITISLIIGLSFLIGCKKRISEIRAFVSGDEFTEYLIQFSIVDTLYNDSTLEFMKIVTKNGIHYIEDIRANKLNYGDTIANGRVRVFLDNVKIGEFYMIDGKLEGTCTAWYPSGSIQSECHYINGKRNGYYIFWDEKGKILNKMNFKDDVPLEDNVDNVGSVPPYAFKK